MEPVWSVIIRTIVAFLLMLILTRMLGKKQLSQMTYFTYITGITFGSVAAEVITNYKDLSFVAGLAGLVLWAVLALAVEYITLKFGNIRTTLDGEPSIVIKNGVIQQHVMKQIRLNMDDLTMLLRNNKVFSIQNVDYAILEPNGKLSVLKKPAEESVTKGDMQIAAAPRMYLPAEIIVDGRVIMRNLKELGLTRSWLDEQLLSYGIKRAEDVFFAELKNDGTLFAEKKAR